MHTFQNFENIDEAIYIPNFSFKSWQYVSIEKILIFYFDVPKYWIPLKDL